MRTVDRLRKSPPDRRRQALGEAMGLAPVTERQRLEKAASRPLKGGDRPPPARGLFDLDARDQVDLVDWLDRK
ncbi:hypothetical protein [Methylocystis sp.]|uniref:hypothetical protein n=1 Tax=Methylocystis sp. TaxID=1911079 RepID=UPI00273673F4|nr:hypothetical protein [Methylocystis sp.]MDP3554841.1 hypothetical protein [Methylocystis sp.]